VLLWAKNNTTGGEKGLGAKEEKKVSQCCFGPKTIPRAPFFSPSAALDQKTEPQKEKKVSPWSFKDLRLRARATGKNLTV